MVVACAIVFAGRLLLHLLRVEPPAPGRAAATPLTVGADSIDAGKYLGLGPHFADHPAVSARVGPLRDGCRDPDLTYIMLGWGLQVVVGLAGLLDLGYVAFYAVGAYSYALLAQHFGFSFWICLPLAGILAAFWGVILGFPGPAAERRLSRHRHARLRRDHSPRSAELARIHRRPDGSVEHSAPLVLRHSLQPRRRTALPQPSDSNSPNLHRQIFLYYLIVALALVTFFVTNRLRKLPIGRAWEALARG